MMRIRLCSIFGLVLVCSCARDAMDPLALAPAAPFSTWTEMGGNCLVSSRYCQILLPRGFGDEELNLAELVDIALQNNPQTRVTWGKARSAAAEYGQSLSSYYPNVYASWQYVRQKGGTPQIQQTLPAPSGSNADASKAVLNNNIGTVLGAPNFYSTQAGPDVTLSYVLFDFGQRTAATTAAREALFRSLRSMN